MLILITILLIFSSCYIHKLSYGEGAVEGYTKTDKQHNFILGFISEETSILEEIKNEKNYEVEIKMTLTDGLISFLTAGLYVPTTIIVKK